MATHTPKRNIRVHGDVWAAAMRRADEEGTTVSAAVVAFLEDYSGVTTPQPPRAVSEPVTTAR
jgi:macrodomain Ter protein organizer (MatP/YcbG family)